MHWLIERFKTAPDRTAFIHRGKVITYSEVIKKIDFYSLQLQSSNIRAGDVVILVGDYSPEIFCLMLSLVLNNNIILPLTMESVIDESVALSISGSDWRIELCGIQGEIKVRKQETLSDSLLIEEFRTQNNPGLVLFSSGSSGLPKAMLYNFNRILEKFRKQRKPVIAIPFLMIDHFGGINTIFSIVTSLGTVVTTHDRAVSSICLAIEKYKVELLPTTPSFLTLLMASKIYNQFDLRSINRISYGTEVMPQTTLDRVKSVFPNAELLQTYGLSEVGVLRSQSRSDGSLWMKIGGDGFETKVVDGILWVRSEYGMEGYLNATSEFDSEGWFNTRDRVEVDGEFFKILGRTTDLINVGGQKVYPAEVENFLLQIDNVLDVVVYGEVNSILGQIVVAKFQLKEPESAAQLKHRVRQLCAGKLTGYKIPSKVLVTSDELYSSRQKKIRLQLKN